MLSRYDRHGLWSHGNIYFSRDGSFKKTVRHLIHEAEDGSTRLGALLDSGMNV